MSDIKRLQELGQCCPYASGFAWHTLENGSRDWYVAKDDALVVGFVCCHYVSVTGLKIDYVCTNKKGSGSQLIRYVINKYSDALSISIQAVNKDARGIEWIKKLGFEEYSFGEGCTYLARGQQ